MGKKQHQKDKLYLTTTEWRQDWGGKKQQAEIGGRAKFRRLPFTCCALSMQPFDQPYCTKEGVVFDLIHILPFLKKHGVNPVSGDAMVVKDLIKLNYHKNPEGKYHCPVTFKVFNENSHIVAVRTSGNVYAFEAVQRLNINAKNWRDLMTDEAFQASDIIHLQDPTNLDKFNIQDFYFVKQGLFKEKSEKRAEELKEEAKTHVRNVNAEAQHALAEHEREYKSPQADGATSDLFISKASTSASGSDDVDEFSAANYSTGRAAAALTSTVEDRVLRVEPAKLDEDAMRYKHMEKKKGYVRLVTTLGPLNFELHCDLVPKTCDNFIRHCRSGYYKGCKFFRSVKNFIVETGDPTNSGFGGKSAFPPDGAPFEDEILPQLSHNSRGILAMSNDMANYNKSQFFITYRPCKQLDKHHTIFGKLVGGFETLSALEALENGEGDHPLRQAIILDTPVFVDPYAEFDEKVKQRRAEKSAAAIAKPAPVKTSASPSSSNGTATSSGTGVGKYIDVNRVKAQYAAAGPSTEPAKKPKLGA